ncbi:unnamed protein product [Hyaloperonospora brassicae]|uniref:Protein kinase domain-containing protein n=1 Tax=Hyaloperonospora brassicae TaxID=162125 RepID=A0AAV0T0K4_HYABA|nr:unnamed protein product [Hyaloperonospora brassicae]
MQTLVEGQTLLHDGRYRFLRRIGSGTFAVIMRALDVQHDRHVAIKCVRQQALKALGEREAAVLQHINDRDADGACAVVRLLTTFEEHGHYCLVLELLGAPVLDVGRWGPWRQPRSGARAAPPATLQLWHRPRRSSAAPDDARAALFSQSPGQQWTQYADGDDAAAWAPPVSLRDVRQMAVHLCGALAFVHDEGLIHADLKPENVVRSGPDAPLRPSTAAVSCSSPVKLVDFGNCFDAHELAAYADVDARGGFDVQTVTYRAPEVAAGLLLCAAMDMWSLGCLLVECVSGTPLFTLPPLEPSVQEERADVVKRENTHLLEQIERVVTQGVPLTATCAPYRSSACYHAELAAESKRGRGHRPEAATTLQARLEAAAPGQHEFHDFICSLLDVNPAMRVTARQALFHPFLQALFPFKTVFARSRSSETHPATTGRAAARTIAPASAIADTKRKASQASRSRDHEVQEASNRALKSQRLARTATSARTKDLRQVLKVIPRHRFSHPPH